MARKKHKAGKCPANISRAAAPIAQFSARDAWLFPLLGALALVVAWLAMLGGVADGTLDWRQTFDYDTTRLYLMFRDLFHIGGYSPSDWSLSASSYFFPDLVFQWMMLALGAGLVAVLYALPLAQVALAAAGWMLVCDLLYGKSPVRRAAVWLLHALAFLLLAWRGGDFLGLHLTGVFHYGAWATIPWLLWLSLRALEDDLSSPKSRLALAGTLLFVAAAAASDLVIFPWFVVPAAAAAAALLTTRRDPAAAKALAAYFAALAAGMALGPALAEIPGIQYSRSVESQFSFNPELTVRAVDELADILSRMAADNGLEAVVWILFVAVALWRLAIVVPRLDILRRGGKDPRAFHPLFGVPPGRAHRYCAVFVPFSAAAAVGAVLATGNLHPFPWVTPEISRLGRHFLPFFYFPLFVGWALLPWKFSRLPVPPVSLVFAAFAGVVLLAAPKALSIERDALDPHAAPFQQCFAENARRLEWRAGLAPVYLTHMLVTNPAAGVEKMAAVNVERGERPRLTPNVSASNVSWWRRGDFQFVVVNLFNGRIYGRPPRAADKGCAPSAPEFLQCMQATPYILDEATARGTFGEPAEVIDCAGVGLFHYDPPLRLDPPENPEELRSWTVTVLP